MKKESPEDAAENGRLEKLIRRYLEFCRSESDGKKVGRFPNLAGFCRWLGCGVDAIDRLRVSHPDAADYLCAVMEDEALNYPVLSPTLAVAYLKRRLAYSEKPLPAASQTDCGEMRLVFEHDIAEDGA